MKFVLLITCIVAKSVVYGQLSLCKTNPCAFTTCAINTRCVLNTERCTARCEPLKIPQIPIEPSKCDPCKCRNCGINGQCVADKNDCTYVCAEKCKQQFFCFVPPCQFHKCDENEICVPGCKQACSHVCLKKQRTINHCALIRCAAGFECKVLGCKAQCVSKNEEVEK